MNINNFKPQLLPNFGVGVIPQWNKLISKPSEWMFSEKMDGCRVEIIRSNGFGRSLKQLQSKQLNKKIKDLQIPNNIIIEAELWGEGLSFGEIQHFMSTKDFEDPIYRYKLQQEWVKTKGGRTYYAKKKGNHIVRQYWEFPGRTVEWLCTWPSELKLFVFDFLIEGYNYNKLNRYLLAKPFVKNHDSDFIQLTVQKKFHDMVDVLKWYKEIVDKGGEGLMAYRQTSMYKTNRITVKENQAYKIKDDNIDFKSVVIDVLEGTYVDPNAEKTVNELGRSITSKRIEDRLPSGKAKGFLVETNGVEHTVSLKGFTDDGKKHLLENKDKWIGLEIPIKGMKPTKKFGAPRSAFYILK